METELEEIKEKLRSYFNDDLFLFNKWVVNKTNKQGKNMMTEKLHKRLCDFVSHRKKNKLLILQPVGSFKSSLITVGFSLQQICKDRNTRILLDAETKAIAVDYLQEIKGNLEHNRRLRWLYGNFVPQRGWKEDQIRVTGRTKRYKEPTVATSGVDNPATERHFPIIVIDDLVSNMNSNTPEQRKKVLDHFKNILHRVEDENSLVIVVGTRWNYYDVYAYIIEEMKDEFDSLVLDAEDDGNGNLLFPEKLTEEFLMNEKKRLGSLYSALYRNKPVVAESQLFKPEWFKNIYYKGISADSPGELPANLVFYTAVDPASSINDESCYYVVLTAGYSRMNKLYIDDVQYGHFTPDEGIRHIISSKLLYNPQKVGIETNNFQVYIKNNLEKELDERHIYMNIIELSHYGKLSKDQRIETLEPWFKNGDIKIKEGIKEVEEEALQYPKGKKDVLDALSMILELIPRHNYKDKPGVFDRPIINKRTGW